MITNYSVLLVLLGLGIAAKCHAIDHDKYEPAHVRTIREASENERGVRTRIIRRKLNTTPDGSTNASSTNQRTRNTPGNIPQEKFKTDYVNNESRHVTTSRPDINQETKIEQRQRPLLQLNKQEDRQIEQEADSSNRKQIVKKDVDSEFGLQLGFTGGTEYISNFNMNPLNIEQLNIPQGEKQIIQRLASLGNQNHQFIPNPIPIQIPPAYPALEKLQQNSAHQIFGYKIIPNVQIQPSSIQGVKQQQIIPSLIEARLESALEYIHNEPQVKDRLENLPKGFNIPFENVQEKPRIVNQIPIQNSQTYTSTEDYTKEFQGYGDYQQQNSEVTQKRSNLSSQNTYPLILLDPDAKLGLPFYPSSKEIHQIPDQEYNYEGIPRLGPNLEGKRYNNENQTEEEKEQQRRYLLGETSGLDIPPPVGYTRETIWQAGDPDADPVPEELTLQLNETCAYITWNQSRPGNEDHRPNIWQAGDFSAKVQDEGLVLSANITCETYGQNILENVTGPYTILDYCWQCVKNDGQYAYKNFQNKLVIPQYIPDTYGPNNPQMNKQNQQNYDSSNQQPNYNQQQDYNQQLNNNQQLNYNQQLNANQQLNSNQQYGAQIENYQNPQYENIQEVADTYGLGQNDYDIPDFQQNSSRMKIPIYPNLGYINDPQSQHLGLQRRSTKKIRQENTGTGNNSSRRA